MHYLATTLDLCWGGEDEVPKEKKKKKKRKRGEDEEEEEGGALEEEEEPEVATSPFDVYSLEAARCTGGRASPMFTWQDDAGVCHPHERVKHRWFRVPFPGMEEQLDTAMAWVLELRVFDHRVCFGRGIERLLLINTTDNKHEPPVLSSGGKTDPRTGQVLVAG